MNERITIARQWLGVPFLAHGRSREGIDCIGLALAALGEKVPVPDYGMRDGQLLIETMRRYFKPVARAAGCLLLISPKWGATPQHIALYTGHSIIHCRPRTGVVEQPYRGAWLKLTHSAWT